MTGKDPGTRSSISRQKMTTCSIGMQRTKATICRIIKQIVGTADLQRRVCLGKRMPNRAVEWMYHVFLNSEKKTCLFQGPHLCFLLSKVSANRYFDTIFRPMIEAMSVEIKKRRQKVAGSRKNRMPTNTVPTAPMPVHTA